MSAEVFKGGGHMPQFSIVVGASEVARGIRLTAQTRAELEFAISPFPSRAANEEAGE